MSQGSTKSPQVLENLLSPLISSVCNANSPTSTFLMPMCITKRSIKGRCNYPACFPPALDEKKDKGCHPKFYKRKAASTVPHNFSLNQIRASLKVSNIETCFRVSASSISQFNDSNSEQMNEYIYTRHKAKYIIRERELGRSKLFLC